MMFNFELACNACITLNIAQQRTKYEPNLRYYCQMTYIVSTMLLNLLDIQRKLMDFSQLFEDGDGDINKTDGEIKKETKDGQCDAYPTRKTPFQKYLRLHKHPADLRFLTFTMLWATSVTKIYKTPFFNVDIF